MRGNVPAAGVQLPLHTELAWISYWKGAKSKAISGHLRGAPPDLSSMANDTESLRSTLDLVVSKDHSPGSQEKLVAPEKTNSIGSPPPVGKLPPNTLLILSDYFLHSVNSCRKF